MAQGRVPSATLNVSLRAWEHNWDYFNDYYTLKKRIYRVNKIIGHGWPSAYVIDWILYVIE